MAILTEIIRSPCSSAPCEDVFGFRRRPDGLHVWVIDGATSIAAKPNPFRADMTDPAWFARAVSRGLFAAVRHGRLEPEALAAVLDRLRRQYLARCGETVAVHDHPLAALTYLHIRSAGPATHPTTHVWSLEWADCFWGRREISPDALTAPRRQVTEMRSDENYARLPLEPAVLARMQAHRRRQIAEGVGGALTLRPESAFAARQSSFQSDQPLLLLCGSDGFERLWRSYAARSFAEVCESALAGKLSEEMIRLRSWERLNRDRITELKRIDDATVLMVVCGTGRRLRPGGPAETPGP